MDLVIDSGIPSEKEPAVPRNVVNGMERYSDAYKKVYGVPPECHYDGEYIRIHGQAQGVTLGRLREMTNQLIWRAG